jgi:hypothetical protein
MDTIGSMDQSLPLVRRAAAEGIAAFALVFAGCGAIVTDAQYEGRSAPLASASCSG